MTRINALYVIHQNNLIHHHGAAYAVLQAIMMMDTANHVNHAHQTVKHAVRVLLIVFPVIQP